MFETIIPLGRTCTLSSALQSINLKKETTLFEWLNSNNLTVITDTIEHIANNILDDSILSGGDGGIQILNPDLYSAHYKLEEYKQIFARRSRRFLDGIQTNKNVLFIRENKYGYHTSEDEIVRFHDTIRNLNSSLEFKILIIDIVESHSDFKKMNNNHVIHKYHLKNNYISDLYTDDKLHTQNLLLKLWLDEIGIQNTGVVHQNFNDRSDF